VKLKNARVVDDAGGTSASVDIRTPVGIEMRYVVTKPGKTLIPNFHFYNEHGACIFISHDWSDEWRRRPREVGEYVSRCQIPGNFLAEGNIFVKIAVSTYEPFQVHFVESDALSFNVVDSLEGDSARGDYAGLLPGIVRPILDWETDFIERKN
jgi:lipopolysaccharide transport system ATP-binding protein